MRDRTTVIFLIGVGVLVLFIILGIITKRQGQKVKLAEESDLFFTDFNPQTDIKNGRIVLLTFGLPMFEFNREERENNITKKYGFKYANQGCIVDSLSTIAADKYNDYVINYLKSRNGIDWYEKYQKELKLLDDSIEGEMMADVIQRDSTVQEAIKMVDSVSNHKKHLIFLPEVIDTTTELKLYRVKVIVDNGIALTHLSFTIRFGTWEIIQEK